MSDIITNYKITDRPPSPDDYVIVIIGLIVAGVVGGQALVKQAKLRAVISDYNKYKVAYHTFKLEYNAFPGDMGNASAYWGAQCGTNTTLASVSPWIDGARNDRCNGNSDGIPQWYTFEILNLFLHLSLSGLIEGNYSGDSVGYSAPDGTTLWRPNINVPGSSWGEDSFYFIVGLQS